MVDRGNHIHALSREAICAGGHLQDQCPVSGFESLDAEVRSGSLCKAIHSDPYA